MYFSTLDVFTLIYFSQIFTLDVFTLMYFFTVAFLGTLWSLLEDPDLNKFL